MTWRTFLTIALLVALTSSTQAQNYRNQDAAVGGLAGAVIGGIIGHQNDETPEGALIGGAVGAIAGGVLGNAKDKTVARQRHYQHQAWHQHQQNQQQALGRAVTINDVVSMTQTGLSDNVIINHIRTNGVLDQVGTHQIIAMHQRGVSEHVISAMQRTQQVGTALSVNTVARRETVVVHRPVAPRPPKVIVHEQIVVPQRTIRYATRPAVRPAFPTHPARHRYPRYW